MRSIIVLTAAILTLGLSSCVKQNPSKIPTTPDKVETGAASPLLQAVMKDCRITDAAKNIDDQLVTAMSSGGQYREGSQLDVELLLQGASFRAGAYHFDPYNKYDLILTSPYWIHAVLANPPKPDGSAAGEFWGTLDIYLVHPVGVDLAGAEPRKGPSYELLYTKVRSSNTNTPTEIRPRTPDSAPSVVRVSCATP